MERILEYQMDAKGICEISFSSLETSLCLNQLFFENLLSLIQEIREKKELKGILFKINEHQLLSSSSLSELFTRSPKNIKQKLKTFHSTLWEWFCLKIPKVALVFDQLEGSALELALWCDFVWIPEEKDFQIHFPQIQEGIPPFLGGIVNLTYKIGLTHALEFFLSSQPIAVEKAKQIGLIDHIQPMGTLEEGAKDFLFHLIQKQEKKGKPFYRPQPRYSSWLARYFAKRKYRHLLKPSFSTNPALKKILETALQASATKEKYSLNLELKGILELCNEESFRNWLNLHLQAQETQKVFFQSSSISPQFQSSPLVIVGAGNKGGSLATTLIKKNYPVRLKDVNHQALGMGLKKIRSLLQKEYSHGELEKRFALLSPTIHYSGMRHAPLLIEAVMEEGEIKKKVLLELERVCSPNSIIATTATSLSVSHLAKEMSFPSRLLGLHCSSISLSYDVVEVVYTPQTDMAKGEELCCFLASLGKLPILVKDSPGFLLGRTLTPYLNEALLLLEEGALVEEIDQAMVRFGMSYGPLSMIDYIGMDELYHFSKTLEQAPPYYQPSLLIEKFYKIGRLGIKSGKGFYLLDNSHLEHVDPKIYDLIKDIRKERKKVKEEYIVDRLLLPLIREAVQCLEEEVVENPKILEVALSFAMTFPPSRGGILKYAESRGWENIVKGLKKLRKNLGERFDPGEVLVNYWQRKNQIV